MLEQGDYSVQVICKGSFFQKVTAALSKAGVGVGDYPVPVLLTHMRGWANNVKKELELYMSDDTVVKASYSHVEFPGLELVEGLKKRVKYSQLDFMQVSRVSTATPPPHPPTHS